MPKLQASGAFAQALDDNARALNGAYWKVYFAGTTTQATTYSNALLTIANAWPVIGDAAGRLPDIYVAPGNYRIRVETAGGVLIAESDNNVVYGIDPGDPAAAKFATVALMLADDTTGYSIGGSVSVVVTAGDLIEAGGFRYSVLASGATDQDMATAGGVKLRALAGQNGTLAADAIGTAKDGATDDQAKIQGASDANDLTVLSGGTYALASAVSLVNAKGIAGLGRRSSTLLNTASTAALEYLGGAGTSKHFGVSIRDLKINTTDYAAVTGYGVRAINQGYPDMSNVEIWGGQSAAFFSEGNVGQMHWNTQFARAKAGTELNNPSVLAGNTIHSRFGGATDIVESCIKNTGEMKALRSFAHVWQNFNKLTEQTDSGRVTGLMSIGDWFEGYGAGQTTVDASGISVSNGDDYIYLEGTPFALFESPYVSGPAGMDGGRYPSLRNVQIQPSGATAQFLFRNQDTDKVFNFDGRQNSWGDYTNYGIISTLPKLGDWSTPDEKHYRQGTFNSIGIANAAGIYEGHGGPCANLFDTPLNQQAFVPSQTYWPFRVAVGGTFSITTGQPDPWGGATAITIGNGVVGSSSIPEFNGGAEWATVVIIAKAQTAGDVLRFRINAINGLTWQKLVDLEMPDTEWRIYHWQQYIPANAGADFRIELGTNGGGVVIARAACFNSPNIYPALNYGQALTVGFHFRHGNVEIPGTAIPTTGTWYVGDRVINRTPSVTASNMVLKEWVCTVAGSPGTWVPQFLSTVSPAT